MRGIRGGGIAAQFVRALVLVAVVSVIAVWLGLALIFRRGQVRSVAETQAASAEKVAILIADYFDAAIRNLQIFDGIEAPGTLGRAEANAALERFLMYAQPVFSQVALLDSGGREVAKASRFHSYLPGELADLGDSPAFRAASAGDRFLSDVYVSREGGLLSVSIALPLMARGAGPRCVLVAELNASGLWSEVADIRIGETGYVYLVDSRGRFVAYQEPSTILQRYGEDMRRMPPVADFIRTAGTDVSRGAAGGGAAGIRRYRGLTGAEALGLYVPVRGSSWAVVAELPVREAFADLDRLQLYIAVVGIVGAATAGLAGLVVASRLSRPVAALTEAARRLGEGEEGDVSLDLGRDDELGVLARAFRSMQESLRARSGDLARRLDELTEAKAELLRSERKFHGVFDQTFQLMGILDAAGRLVEANQNALDLIDRPKDEVLGRPFWETPWWEPFPAQATALRSAISRSAGGSFERFEVDHLDRDGRPLHIDFSLKPVLDEEGKVVLLVAEGRDITERKTAERTLKSSLREKEILLKEIHHRVKNNLQVIVSLLSLQSSRISDPEVVQVYEEGIGRVRTMAQVHELLYQSPSLSGIDLAEQVRLIADDLYNAYRHGFGEVRLSVEAESVELGVDQAIPCGLLVNEVLTNSFKYAFPPASRAGGLVSIRLAREEGDRVSLEISDDGIGIPKGVELGGAEWIGLSLVSLLVEQLRGTVELDRSAGTRYLIRFRVPTLPGTIATKPAP